MKRLAEVVGGRDNNFHLLRLLAAAAVLLSHSFPLATGDKASEPLRAAFGCTPGSIAVDLFLLVSGMLVTISLLRRNSAVDFAKARFFRIWPGLAVALLLTIFVLGPVFTTLQLSQYFKGPDTLRYAYRNLIMFRGMGYVLPGVFAHNPWPDAVNGSLWTLPSEVKCYLCLLAGWFVLAKLRRPQWFKAALSVAWVVLLVLHVRALTQGTLEDSPPRLFLMFCTGAMLYLYRTWIPLSGWAAAGAIALVALCAGHGMLFGLAYSLALPYLMLCFAYLPGGHLLAFNRLGDYSYGTYIYAYPIQQTLMAVHPGLTPLQLFSLVLPLTLILAVISWHVVEKPSTRLAQRRPAARPIGAAI